ncbi:MAG: DUF4846 domain-containing protein [Chitinophagaceae bacterium]
MKRIRIQNTQNIVTHKYGIFMPGTLSNSMLRISLFFLLPTMTACGSTEKKSPVVAEALQNKSAESKTIGGITTPKGFTRITSEAGSFAAWLRTVPLKKDKAVYLYNGKLKPNQSAQFAVIDIPTGKKDLQQCADVVMRLRAEYLFSQKKYADISFMDYNGKWYRWQGRDSRPLFDNYLETVFGWCGSASLEKQLKPVTDINNIKIGDVFVQGGFPGHAVIVADMAVNRQGKKVYMLVQGYQPAQDMHVLVNPRNGDLSPWYEADDADETITTPEWTFLKSHLRYW